MTEHLRDRLGRRPDLVWFIAAIVSVLVLFVVPMLWTHRYYFYGDTQIGSFGQWHHFGTELRAGASRTCSTPRQSNRPRSRSSR